ncbi:MAG: tyrosine-type recombinase/integrase [Smithella sp.]
MPKQTRYKTKKEGVYYITSGRDKIFYIYYRKDGKQIEEKAGKQSGGMTPAKASLKRAIRISGKEMPNAARRELEKAEKLATAEKMTIEKLWAVYKENRERSKGFRTDESRYNLYLKDDFGEKEPHEIIRLETDRLRINLLKKKKPQTVKHVFTLLKRIINFGVSRELCKALSFKIGTIKVDNEKTEDLNPDQLKALITAINASTDIQAANIMKLALFTGMRRGEMFKLKWDDVDFERGFIFIRDPKGGLNQKIPLNEQARAVLESHPRHAENVFVRTEKNAEGTIQYFTFNSITERVNTIKKAAKLPADFRALHGLRHTYASMLASSGAVDLYTLQKLLTHKSSKMTQRYAHLHDDALIKAASFAGKLMIETSTPGQDNVVELNTGEQDQ